jgi:sec-independent protein translocase protein TatB
MFGIDFSEILVIFGIALVVLGPEKLPRVAATVGRWLGRARHMARQFREQLEQEADNLNRAVELRERDAAAGRAPATPATPATPAMTPVPEPAPVTEAAPVPPPPAAVAASPEVPPHSAPPAAAAADVAAAVAPASGHNTVEMQDRPAPPPAEAHERGR